MASIKPGLYARKKKGGMRAHLMYLKHTHLSVV